MDLRLKRLKNEYSEITNSLKNSKYISIYNSKGNPPDRYFINYNLDGLNEKNNEIVKSNSFNVEIILPIDYPQSAPFCRILNPVFHPNIAPHKICIADSWTSGESLIDIIIRIGEMITFQNYNIKSPLNGEAAKWVTNNINMLPIDNRDVKEGISFHLTETDSDKELIKPPPELYTCEACNKTVEKVIFCSSNHKICENCKITCATCDKVVCTKCVNVKCSLCNSILCNDCIKNCHNCHNSYCDSHFNIISNLCVNCDSANKQSNHKISYEEIENSENLYSIKSMYCTHCGQKIHSDSNFCFNCGQKV